MFNLLIAITIALAVGFVLGALFVKKHLDMKLENELALIEAHAESQIKVIKVAAEHGVYRATHFGKAPPSDAPAQPSNVPPPTPAS